MSEDKQRSVKHGRAELERLAAMPDEAIDTSDIAEVADWSKAEVGKFYRPMKKQVTLRIDADVLAWFKAQGLGYQTEINRVLREHVRASPRRGSLTARSGAICPESGTWRAKADPGHTIAVTKGDRMPTLNGKAIAWIYWRAT